MVHYTQAISPAKSKRIKRQQNIFKDVFGEVASCLSVADHGALKSTCKAYQSRSRTPLGISETLRQLVLTKIGNGVESFLNLPAGSVSSKELQHYLQMLYVAFDGQTLKYVEAANPDLAAHDAFDFVMQYFWRDGATKYAVDEANPVAPFGETVLVLGAASGQGFTVQGPDNFQSLLRPDLYVVCIDPNPKGPGVYPCSFGGEEDLSQLELLTGLTEGSVGIVLAACSINHTGSMHR